MATIGRVWGKDSNSKKGQNGTYGRFPSPCIYAQTMQHCQHPHTEANLSNLTWSGQQSATLYLSYSRMRTTNAQAIAQALKVMTASLMGPNNAQEVIPLNRACHMQGLFWLVFSTMGMHLFGGLQLEVGRTYPNYDTFLNSLISSFNVLNLENWNQQMYAIARASNGGAIAYYLVRYGCHHHHDGLPMLLYGVSFNTAGCKNSSSCVGLIHSPTIRGQYACATKGSPFAVFTNNNSHSCNNTWPCTQLVFLQE
jgi:hypothetical protein